jgi:hypothetical protein
MIKRTCLLIDDAKQDDVFPAITREGRKYGIEITCLQFNVGHSERNDLLNEDQEIDLQKVTTIFETTYTGEKIHLLAFDWDLSSTTINGLSIIKAFNDQNIRRSVPRILYSGVLKDQVQGLLDQYKNGEISFKEVWDPVQTLISLGLSSFVSRDDYEVAIAERLRLSIDTVETSIESVLRKIPDLRLESALVSERFRGKSYGEIASMLDNDAHLKAAFSDEIVQQVISHLSNRL